LTRLTPLRKSKHISMAGPDPDGVRLGDAAPGPFMVLVESFMSGNRKARMARAKRILGNREL
jgi:hypothetical protein